MTPVPPKVREAVYARCNGRCEHPGCNARATLLHHRKRRSQGGSHSAENLMALCTESHQWVHDHPAESYAAGWLVHSWDVA